VLAEKLGELLDFHKDLLSLEAATKVFFFFIYVTVIPGGFSVCFNFDVLSYKLVFHTDTIKILGRGNASY